MKARLFVSVLFAILVTAVPLFAASAQDMPERVICDSTLVTLLVVAESNYQYLSHMIGEGMTDAPALQVDLGAFQPLADSIAMRLMAELEAGGAMPELTEEEAAMQEAMMELPPAEIVAAYQASLGMEASEVTELPTGELPDEDPLCTSVRADVEQFLIVKIFTSNAMMQAN